MQVTGTLYKMLEKTSSNPRYARREFVVRTRPGVRGRLARSRQGEELCFTELVASRIEAAGK